MINKQQITRILKQYGIPFWTEGKNVSIDSVNVQCPFCPDRDPSNHCGIFCDTNVFSCWRCNRSGPFVYLLQTLTNLPSEECERIVETGTTFKESAIDQIKSITDKVKYEKLLTGNVDKAIAMPGFAKLITPDIDFPLLFHWLDLRNISINTVIQYRCEACRAGKYMNRIVIPVFSNGDLAAYQALDLSGFADVKCKTSTSNINNYLYGYDNIINNRMIITEGVLDCWRVGEDSVASFGTHITERQKELILDKELDELIFCWDGETWFKAKKQAEFFAPFIGKIKVVKLPGEEDPDDYGKEYGEECLLDLIKQTVWM